MSYGNTLKRIFGGLVAGALTISASSVMASGFQNYDESARTLRQLHAGDVSSAEDAATAYLNPAGMVYLEHPQVVAAATTILADFEFDFVRGTTPAGVPLLVRLPGGGQGNAGDTDETPSELAVVPAFHFVYPFTEDFAMGLSVAVPFGLATEYEEDAVQRYLATRSSVITVNINPSFAYRPSKYFSVGGGVSAQYIRADVDRAGDAVATCIGILTNMGDPDAIDNCAALGFPLAASGFADNDFEVRNQADDWGFGWNVGIIITPIEGTRLGASYRSKVSHDLRGDTDVDGAGLDKLNTVFGEDVIRLVGLVDQNVEGEVDLPEIARFGIFHELTKKIDIMAEVAFTRWSRFDELALEFDILPPSVTQESWRDTWRYSAAIQYHHNDNWAASAGYMYDQTPIRDRFRTVRLPGSSRQWFGGGIQYTTDSECLIFDVGYAFVTFENDIDLNETSGLATLVGDYEGNAHLIAAQVTWNIGADKKDKNI